MPLNNSGPISLGGSTAGQSIALELSLGVTSQISLDDAAVRGLAGVASGAITMPTDFYGKPSGFSFTPTITSNTNDYNLRNAAITAGWDQVTPLSATVTINAGVFVGSSSTGSPAFQTGSTFPSGSTLAIVNNGFIVGRGGNGGGSSNGGQGGGGGAGVANSSGGASNSTIGSGPGANGTNTTGGNGQGIVQQFNAPLPNNQLINGTAGSAGGLALSVGYPTTITNNGTIGGGGGGGGQGSFSIAGPVNNKTITSQSGGRGGDLGAAGADGGGAPNNGAGGAAGAAVTGNSNITWLAFGTRLGAIS